MAPKNRRKPAGNPSKKDRGPSRWLNVKESRAHIVSGASATPAFQVIVRDASDEDSAVDQIADLLPAYFSKVNELPPREHGEIPAFSIARDVVTLLRAMAALSPP